VVRDHTARHRASVERYAAAFETRETLASYLAKAVGEELVTLALGRPEMMDGLRESMKRGLEKAHQAPPPAAAERRVAADDTLNGALPGERTTGCRRKDGT
jgi:hypothetical protein